MGINSVNSVFALSSIFVGVGSFFLYKGYGLLQRKKIIEGTETTKLKLLKEGIAEIKGKAHKKESVLKAPFSGEDCFWYKYHIEKPVEHDDDSSRGVTRWKDLAVGYESVPFLLDDETGKAEIYPEGADVEVSTKNEYFSGGKKEPTDMMKKILDEKRVDYKGIFGLKHLRYREQLIKQGDGLYVLGIAAKGASNSASRYLFRKNGNLYYITDKDEKQIVGLLSQRMAVWFVGGGILMSIGLFFLSLLI